ncbi:MAG: hypothetical protein JRH14_21595 [Deltaproteobacteria bacterium]|nr:hypothetical protein [Deltaproteobacteria bacterium]
MLGVPWQRQEPTIFAGRTSGGFRERASAIKELASSNCAKHCSVRTVGGANLIRPAIMSSIALAGRSQVADVVSVPS